MAKSSKRSSRARSSVATAASAVSRVSSAAISAAASRADPPDPATLERRSEMVGVIIVFAALLFGAALLSFDAADMPVVHDGRGASADVQNLAGPVGARIADLLLQLVGLGAFALNALLFVLGYRTVRGRDMMPSVRTIAGSLGATIGGLMLTHLVARALSVRPFGHEAAGFVGSAVAEFTRAFVSTLGTALLGSTLLVMSVSALSGRPLVRMALSGLHRRGLLWGRGLRERAAEQVTLTKQEWQARKDARAAQKEAEAEARRIDEEAREAEEAARREAEEEEQPLAWAPETGLFRVSEDTPEVALPDTRPSRPVPVATPEGFPSSNGIEPPKDLIPTTVRRQTTGISAMEPVDDGFAPPTTQPPTGPAPTGPAPTGPAASDAAATDAQPGDTAPRSAASATLGSLGTISTEMDAVAPPPADARVTMAEALAAAREVDAMEGAAPEPVAATPEPVAAAAVTPAATPAPEARRVPRIVETAALKEPAPPAKQAEQGSLEIGDRKEWKLPPRFLVQSPPDRKVSAPQHVLVDNARVLEQKLLDFKIKGEVTDIRPGPVVTTYEYKPAPGVKISRIVNLKDDLTMSLSALRVRVVAPIPGRDVVGIEVPNKQRQFVYFREVLESEVYASSKSNLTLILGKDIEGAPVVTDLAKAPHMLVAGATGTGKSVGINSFLASMLFKATPDDVKFIMVDPKVLELSVYEGIPHLLLPPIDDPHQAELALKWAVREMERRYRVLAGAKVRNIAGYRAKLPELRENARKKKVKVVDGKKKLVDANSPGAELLDPPPVPEEMPYIVVVIDEFADLIMASGKEVERAVARLAQKARACGIHVILATQRPSTDVITGMIKANFPTRVSFQVASAIDSKVVLNSVGAESLLGMGDLLFVPPGTSHLKRCHGTWITDDEIISLTDHWKSQGTPDYDMSILEDPDAEKPTIEDDAQLDTLFEDAVQVALEAQQASVSFLQRKLGIGYGRAAKIIDQMEAKGIVGPQRSPNKPRELLMSGGEAGL